MDVDWSVDRGWVFLDIFFSGLDVYLCLLKGASWDHVNVHTVCDNSSNIFLLRAL